MDPEYDTTPAFFIPPSQEDFNNVFSPVPRAPAGIRFGDRVPDETRRMARRWMRRKGGTYAPAVAFYTMFPDRFAFVDRTWFYYSGPHWEKDNGAELPQRLVDVLRKDFYRDVVLPIGAWSSQHQDDPSIISEKDMENI